MTSKSIDDSLLRDVFTISNKNMNLNPNYAVIACIVALVMSASLTVTVVAVYAQNTTTTSENSFVNASFNLILGITTGITILSGLALYWVNKVRNALVNSKSENAKKLLGLLDTYIIPALQTGQKVAEVTAKQEIKAKQLGEILYDFMGPKANEIKDKYEVKLVNLTADVDKAVQGTQEYESKLRKLNELVEEMKGEILAKT